MSRHFAWVVMSPHWSVRPFRPRPNRPRPSSSGSDNEIIRIVFSAWGRSRATTQPRGGSRRRSPSAQAGARPRRELSSSGRPKPSSWYHYLESGEGRVDLEKLGLFARLIDAEPFAMLLAAQFGSDRFAVRAAGNKAAMVFMIALEQLNADAGDRMAQLDTAAMLAAFSEAFRKLLLELERREDPPPHQI